MEEIRQVLGGQGMKRFIGEEEELLVDAEFNRKPVLVDKGGVMCCQSLVQMRTLVAEFYLQRRKTQPQTGSSLLHA